MFDATTKSVWYGRLETASSDTPVIYDPGLPAPPTGQIYLYNAERNAILKYAANVVQPLLKGLETKERREVERKLGKQWRTVRKSFLREHEDCIPKRVKQPPKITSSDNSKQLNFDNDVDNDWSDDYDNVDND